MTDTAARERARTKVGILVRAFTQNVAEYTRANSTYNETQVRTEFITPLLEALGWDVYNHSRKPLDLREVYEEATVEVGEEKQSKKPDYELRLARQRKFFIEAKKPCVNIERDRSPSFQTRRYGFSGSLPISVLTNFHQLAIYDCVPAPRETDGPEVARIGLYYFAEYESRFDEIYDKISREAVYSGRFDEQFHVDVLRQGTTQFDEFFLRQVRRWRERLAKDLHHNCPELQPGELTFAVQLFLCRLVFLRICEDRDIEKYESLKTLSAENAFAALRELIVRADTFYNSGLFRLLDDERLTLRINDATLATIIAELYYPQSPYTFAVVEAEVLGEIYEQFLGEVITFDASGQVEVVQKPEVRESGGVVPTPRFIVEAILDRTLEPALSGKSPEELNNFTVADICCGSGIFLLGAFERILNHHLNWYATNDSASHVGTKISEVVGGQWRLMLNEKRRLLLQCIRGVDIDANAVEVAKFSLLLKLIEGETKVDLDAEVSRTHIAVLPSLDEIIKSGNSLVSHDELAKFEPTLPESLTSAVMPFTWKEEFPNEMRRGGFDVIVGNPPYIRIQNMVEYSAREVEYYQSNVSIFTTAGSDNFDKYALFIERSLSLINSNGRVGLIVPHKFMTITAGEAVRRMLSRQPLLESLVHFGAQQVFGAGTSNYTCILTLNKNGAANVRVQQVKDLAKWRYHELDQYQATPISHFGSAAWTIASESAQSVFDRMTAAHRDRLSGVADIFVGVQTSADDIYIVSSNVVTETYVEITKDGTTYQLERDILRPCLHDVTLQAYQRPAANKFMIFPYRLGAKATLIPPNEMAAQFPQALAYLNAHQDSLKKRNIVGGAAGTQQYYQFGRSQSLTKFNTPKIILPALSIEPRYAYDDSNVVVTGGGNGPYYLVRPSDARCSLYFLLAVLCHPLCEAMVRSRTSVFRGGYYSHGKQFIEVLPIPNATPEQRSVIDDLARRIIDHHTAAEAALMPADRTRHTREAAALRTRIEATVTALYGLTEAEMETVRGVPVPT